MKVPDISGRLQSLPSKDIERPPNRIHSGSEAKRQNAQGDELELSAAARETADVVNRLNEMMPATELSESATAEIRERIAQGFYDNRAVSSEVIARLLDFYTK